MFWFYFLLNSSSGVDESTVWRDESDSPMVDELGTPIIFT